MSERGSAFAQTVARVRKAVLRVETPRASGSGYAALPNGIVVTSHSVVGYELMVKVSAGDGTAMDAKVVAVDVSADLVAVLAPPHLGQAALRVPPSLPRLGDTVLIIHQSKSGMIVKPAVIGAVEHQLEGLSHLVVDSPVEEERMGAPVVDVEGRVVGMVCRPRRDFSSDGKVHMMSAILSTAAYDGTIHKLSGGRAEVEGMVPTYNCPNCGAPYSAEVDRCMACGAALPHAIEWRLPLTTRGAAATSLEPQRLLRGARTIRDFVTALGISANRVRTSADTWRVLHKPEGEQRGCEIFLQLDASGDHVLLRSPVANLPSSDHESFLRLLLTLNDDTLGPYRLSVSGSSVFISRTQPLHALASTDPSAAFGTLARMTSHFRSVFEESFGVSLDATSGA